MVAAALALAGCGGDDDDGGDQSQGVGDGGAGDGGAAVDTGFDESSLPDDFPTELIPPSNDSGAWLEASGVRTASFERGTPVDETIAHYTDLLGDPGLSVEGDAGERNAQWQASGWTVPVIGSPDESIIAVIAT